MASLAISRHALDRYCERVRPSLNPRVKHERSRANDEIVRLVSEHGVVIDASPDWIEHRATEERPDADFWVVCGDVALPVIDDVILSVYVKGHISTGQRESRNHARQRARAARRKERHQARAGLVRDWR